MKKLIVVIALLGVVGVGITMAGGNPNIKVKLPAPPVKEKMYTWDQKNGNGLITVFTDNTGCRYLVGPHGEPTIRYTKNGKIDCPYTP